ncbi:MAG: VanZ family protein [Zetaproteobacteria bacterium]|nr:VanZ family protein [Zetaproteobacteria bacterium]
MPHVFSGEDKVVHASAYAAMAWLAWHALRAHIVTRTMLLGVAWLFCLLYGLSDEWHQSFVPGRDADIWDWVADSTGALMMVCLLFLYQRRRDGGSFI